MRVVTSDRGINLHRHAEFFEIAEAGNRRIECSRNSTESVMSLRISAVQTYRDPLDAAIDNLLGYLPGNQSAIRGQRHPQAFIRAITRQLKNIRPEQRFAAAEHQNWRRNLGNLIDDIARRLRG